MKNIIPPERRSETISHIIVVAFAALMALVVLRIDAIVGIVGRFINAAAPFWIGIALAFVLNPVVRNIEKLFKKRRYPKVIRAFSSFCALLLLVAIITLFMGILVPQLISSIRQLIDLITGFVNGNQSAIGELIQRIEIPFLTFEDDQLAIVWSRMAQDADAYLSVVLNSAMTIGSAVYSALLQIFVGIITAFYILSDKEHLCAIAKKMSYAFLPRNGAETIIYWTRRAGTIFSNYIAGKILDSVIIGVLCYFFMLIVRFEYPLLIAVIVGITNVVPFFGPFIGAIPSALILLIINPMHALWFLVFILVLQQVDGNVIGPKILGDHVGVSPLLIMVAIIIGGDRFGFLGMLLSVPVVAFLYAIVRAVTETYLKRRGLATQTRSYEKAPEHVKKYEE